jgi:hypothetical protein
MNPIDLTAFEPAVLLAWFLMTIPITGIGIWLGYKKLAPLWQVNAWVILAQLMLYPQIEMVLGQPKPFAWEFNPPQRLEVLAAVVRPDRDIYIWLRVPGKIAPVSYRIRYTSKRAQGLLDAMSKKEREGKKVWYEPSLAEDLQFYNPPPAGLPPKAVPIPEGNLYDH